MSDILSRICADKRIEVDALKRETPLESFRDELSDAKAGRFKAALDDRSRVNIIAELKKASPSRGELVKDFNVSAIAARYADGGAVALSVLTERKYFQGDPAFMRQAAESSRLPILCKDFVVDPYQFPYAKWKGADAILLIASLYDTSQLSELLTQADETGLDCLCEVHNETELEKAIKAGANIIGVNNRDLNDFSVDLHVSERLADLIPTETIGVTESGIFTRDDVSRLMKHGYNNFLIGEALVKSDDSASLLGELRGV